MKGIIRIGDKTTGGSTVLSGSTTMLFDGVDVAYVGDPVPCPIPVHGRTVIAEGRSTFREKGVPIEFNGHRCACGCALIPSLPVARAS